MGSGPDTGAPAAMDDDAGSESLRFPMYYFNWRDQRWLYHGMMNEYRAIKEAPRKKNLAPQFPGSRKVTW